MQLALTKPQSLVFNCDAEYVAAVAGFGSGKTQAVISRLFATKVKYPSIDLAYLAPSLSLIRDIFYPRMMEVIEASGVHCKLQKNENIIYMQGYGRIICRSMDDPGKIVGWEVGDAFIDEFDILPQQKAIAILEKVSSRTRQRFPDNKLNQKVIITTPEGFKATYKLFKKEPLDNSALVQMSTYSNQHNLPPGFIEARIKQYSTQLVEAYINGQFVNLVSGNVYCYFDRLRHHTNRTVKKGEPLQIGMDFNVGKMAAVVFAPYDGTKLEIIGELIGYNDTPSIILAIKQRYPGHTITVFPDAAGKNRNTTNVTITDHKLLKMAGFRVKPLKANPLVKERVQSVNTLFEHDKLFINTDAAPETTEALEQQPYDRNGVPDKTLDIDHPLDALGYRICNGWLLSRTVLNYEKAVA